MKTFGTISASRLKTYLMCPFKYYLEYELGIRKGPSFATENGSLIHAQIEKILQGHKKNWKQELLWHYKRIKPWVYHKDFQTHRGDCPGCKMLEGLDHYHGKIDWLFWGNKSCPLWHIEEAVDLIQGIIDRQESPMNYPVIDVEKKFRIDIGDGVVITGFIDLVSMIDKYMLEIRDWKTGNWLPTYEEALVDPQLRLYDLAASYLYPEYETRMLTFDYIKKKSYSFTISDDQREENRRWIIDTVHKIEQDMKPFRISNNPATFWKCKVMCQPQVCDDNYPGRVDES